MPIYNSRWFANGRPDRFKLVRITSRITDESVFCHWSFVTGAFWSQRGARNRARAQKPRTSRQLHSRANASASWKFRRSTPHTVSAKNRRLAARCRLEGHWRDTIMKRCPECGGALNDEYQFCPEDGASLSQPQPIMLSAAQPDGSQAPVMLYCPACASEYPLTFAQCPVHLTVLSEHAIPKLRERQSTPPETENETPGESLATAGDRPLETGVTNVAPPPGELERAPATEGPSQQTILAAESSSSPAAPEIAAVAASGFVPHAGMDRGVAVLDPANEDDASASQVRRIAIGITLALGLLAVFGVYSVITHATRGNTVRPSRAGYDSVQPILTVATPTPTRDSEAPGQPAAQPDAAPAIRRESAEPEPPKLRYTPSPTASPTSRQLEARYSTAVRTPAMAPPPRRMPQPPPAAPPRQMPAPPIEPRETRGSGGLVDARLVGLRSSRTTGGYRYDLTFHLADRAGHPTQWERLAILTRSASGATRQQQIPFYHRLGADGTMSFTVSVEMHGRAPADWQGHVLCTSIGSDSTGRAYRASFGANVSPN